MHAKHYVLYVLKKRLCYSIIQQLLPCFYCIANSMQTLHNPPRSLSIFFNPPLSSPISSILFFPPPSPQSSILLNPPLSSPISSILHILLHPPLSSSIYPPLVSFMSPFLLHPPLFCSLPPYKLSSIFNTSSLGYCTSGNE